MRLKLYLLFLMSTIAIAGNPAYDLLPLGKDRRREEELNVLTGFRRFDQTITLDDIKAALGKRHGEGLLVLSTGSTSSATRKGEVY